MSKITRREILVDRMNELETNGISCKGCEGTCCTFEANSMMVTPLEAFELLHHLKTHDMLDEELKEKCQSAVAKYRLDHQVGNGRRSYLRKTYTCPFFHHKELGCPLPRDVKPYGCLAFNTHHPDKKAGADCYSEIKLLETRDSTFPWEAEKNELLKKKFNIFWTKSPIPTALLDIWDKEISAADLGPN